MPLYYTGTTKVEHTLYTDSGPEGTDGIVDLPHGAQVVQVYAVTDTALHIDSYVVRWIRPV